MAKKLEGKKKLFAERVARTGKVFEAAKELYAVRQTTTAGDLDKKSKQLMADPKVIEKITQIWDREGLTLSKAVKAHLKILSGKGKKFKGADMLNAVKLVYDGHNALPKSAEVGEGSLHVGVMQFFINQRQARGLPIPKELKNAIVVEKK